jgi:membrane associated rhomboid family serine protease
VGRVSSPFESGTEAARPSIGVNRVVQNGVPVAVMLAIMWVEEVIDVPLRGRLDRFGIVPRRIGGLDGIVFSPFLHAGFRHLIANTIPFAVLGLLIALSGLGIFLRVTLIVGLIGGVGTWLTGGTNSVHIGASGLVFGYLTYLVARGFFARKVAYILGGIAVTALYGGVLWGLLPSRGISWQGHLFGAIGGIVAAAVLHRHSNRVSGAGRSGQLPW